MSNLKVGDKVRIIYQQDFFSNSIVNKVGVISNVDYEGYPAVQVKFEKYIEGHKSWWFDEENLEKIEEYTLYQKLIKAVSNIGE